MKKGKLQTKTQRICKQNIEVDFVPASKGITLITLVITIISLLILAGITISLTIGQRGILNRAREAGKNYQEATKSEEEMLTKFSNEVENIVAGNGVIEEPKYTIVEGVPVPIGFKHTEGTKETGFVIQDISEGKTKGNEFVWVPCTENGADGSIKYDRYAFLTNQPADGIDSKTNSVKIKYSLNSIEYFTETIPTTELNSIKRYGGFYIGRYEVGIVEHDKEVKTENSSSEAEWTGYSGGKAVVQKDQQVWNYVTRDMAKIIAQGMYQNNNIVKSRLCSSYAWDTTLKFIGGNYVINSEQGNYKDTTFTYKDLNGDIKTKEKKDKILVPTGQTTAVKNIYDMGGNVWEWTTEEVSDGDYPYSKCGGCYSGIELAEPSNITYPAGFRDKSLEFGAGSHIGMRVSLYIEL